MSVNNTASVDEGASSVPAQDENKLIAERREKLRALRAQGIAFPNDFAPDAFAGDLQAEFEGRPRKPSKRPRAA
jgi:lysyl-tRNA synthetase class 2